MTASLRSGCNLAQRLIEKDSTVKAWRAMRVDCLMLRARSALAQGVLEEARALSMRALAFAQVDYAETRSADAGFTLAGTHLLRGEVAKVMNDVSIARAQFKAGLRVWPANVEMTPRQTMRRLLLLEGLARKDEAAAVAAQLAAMGYRHPMFARERRLVAG